MCVLQVVRKSDGVTFACKRLCKQSLRQDGATEAAFLELETWSHLLPHPGMVDLVRAAVRVVGADRAVKAV